MEIGKDLVAASSAPLVLAILAEGEDYGYAILQRIARVSSGRLQWSEGLLYPLLHRLERLGQVESSWVAPEGGRRRKYYRITADGRRALAEHRGQWNAINDTLGRMWLLAPVNPSAVTV